VALNIYVIRGGGVEKDDLENWKKTLRIRSISDSDRSPERSTFPVWTLKKHTMEPGQYGTGFSLLRNGNLCTKIGKILVFNV
jgi:hypothetical protein